MKALWLVNVAAFSVQLTVVVAAALVAATMLRVRAPRAALRFWQLVLLGGTTLPFMPTGSASSHDAAAGSATVIVYDLAASSLSTSLPGLASIAAVVLVCGTAARIAWLALGLARLRGIRGRSTPLSPMPAFVDDLSARLGTVAEMRVSDEVDGPVTIGLRRPLILLPNRALGLSEPMQRAIVCHELIHVKRRDWAHTVFEQVWCTLLWFHPAAHLLVARLGLMREAVVDRDTLAVTGDRRSYANALLAFAGPAHVPATVLSLIRPRHLARRIALISKEAPMSPRHVVAGLFGALALTSAAAVTGASRFPLVTIANTSAIDARAAIAAQDPVRPGNGVSLPRLVKDVKPQYTPEAMKAKIHGTVWLDVVVLASGDVGEVTVAQSLDDTYGLDEEAVRAAAQWKFIPGRRKGTPVPVLITIEMTFTLK